MTFGTELLLKLSSTQGTWREDGEPVAEINGKGYGEAMAGMGGNYKENLSRQSG